uniref:Brinker DNA-binding domain-containing protein n=1 Tax=Ditylenchus dipsaci TaxID=166011 RepID=A0A915DN18_9BILA
MSNNNSDREPDELQLHDDEGAPVNRKRRRNHDTATKLEAVKWAHDKNSITSAAKEFGLTRSCIKDWKKKEPELMRLRSSTIFVLLDEYDSLASAQIRREPPASLRDQIHSFIAPFFRSSTTNKT